MKYGAIGVAAMAFVAALAAAYYWLRSTNVAWPLNSMHSDIERHLREELSVEEKLRFKVTTDFYSIHRAMLEINALNRNAAIWTGMAAILSALSSLLGLLP